MYVTWPDPCRGAWRPDRAVLPGGVAGRADTTAACGRYPDMGDTNLPEGLESDGDLLLRRLRRIWVPRVLAGLQVNAVTCLITSAIWWPGRGAQEHTHRDERRDRPGDQ